MPIRSVIDTNSTDTEVIDTNSTRASFGTSIRHGVVAHLTSMNAELISVGPIDTAVAAPLPADLTINNEQEWTFRS